LAASRWWLSPACALTPDPDPSNTYRKDVIMNTHLSTQRSPWLFFALVFILAIPLWLLGILTVQGLLKGLGIDLPFSALIFVCPLIAAVLLIYREEKMAGVRRLVQRVFDYKGVRPRLWYAPILVLLPVLYALSYGIMRLLGTTLPAPQISLLTLPILFALFFISAACEEAGWSGYAIDPLQARWGALGASLIVGIVWAAMHVVPDLQGHHTWEWIAGQRCFSVVLRVLIVWLYNNTGKSVFAAILFHDMDNVSVFTLFPNDGGFHYIPAFTAALTAITAVIVTFLWGPKTLARYRYADRTKPPDES
jgi:membrane protease YdiL (CAAX protease family)